VQELPDQVVQTKQEAAYEPDAALASVKRHGEVRTDETAQLLASKHVPPAQTRKRGTDQR